ncbi:hypothetical protein ACYTX7_10240, partial [Streptococcus pyogenes]
ISGNRWTYAEAAESIRPFSEKDAEMWPLQQAAIAPHTEDILRATFWTPPFPHELDVDQADLPWVQAWTKAMGDLLPG